LGWANTFNPLVVPVFFGAPMHIFLLRQFFRTIPQDLFDAARIDGAGESFILLRIVLPLAKAALAVLSIFVFQYRWNDFMGPLIYLQDMKNYTMALGLYTVTAGPEGGYTFPSLMAGTTAMVLPVIVIFAMFQRVFIQGISLTGIKG